MLFNGGGGGWGTMLFNGGSAFAPRGPETNDGNDDPGCDKNRKDVSDYGVEAHAFLTIRTSQAEQSSQTSADPVAVSSTRPSSSLHRRCSR
jgi:hypothetical protein